MLLFFGDDNTCSSGDPKRERDDIFLFGGYYFHEDAVRRFEIAIGEVKARYGLAENLPVKWNLKDDRIVKFYAERKADRTLAAALERADGLRVDLLNLLATFDARVIVCAIVEYDRKDERKNVDYHRWALTDLLQRLGLTVHRKATRAEFNAIVTLDMPGTDANRAYFDLFELAYHNGVSPDGYKYVSGPLRDRGFFPSVQCTSTLHNPFLQIADIILGSTADFVEWCFTGKDFERVAVFFPLVDKRFRLEWPDLFKTGFVVDPDEYREFVRKKYSEFSQRIREKVVQQREA